jgi:hypothetical protein
MRSAHPAGHSAVPAGPGPAPPAGLAVAGAQRLLRAARRNRAKARGAGLVRRPHAGKTVEDGIAFAAPRKTRRAINRHKASDYG